MWFWFSLAALLCWSGSDLFSKLGCKGQDDKRSHLKMLTAVGFVMGLHCAYSVLWGGTVLTGRILLHYLPVSLLYISSMAIGYLGLRYMQWLQQNHRSFHQHRDVRLHENLSILNRLFRNHI